MRRRCREGEESQRSQAAPQHGAHLRGHHSEKWDRKCRAGKKLRRAPSGTRAVPPEVTKQRFNLDPKAKLLHCSLS